MRLVIFLLMPHAYIVSVLNMRPAGNVFIFTHIYHRTYGSLGHNSYTRPTGRMFITNSQYLSCDLQVTYMYTFHRTYRSLGHNSYTRPTGRMLITNIQYLPCGLQVTYMYAFHRTYRTLGISRIQDLQVVCVCARMRAEKAVQDSHDELYKLDARGGCAPSRTDD